MKRAFALLVVPVAAVTLAACGGDSGSSSTGTVSTSSAPAASAMNRHNDQDIMFAQMMIPHHRQAVEMAKLAKTRASMPEVKQLATAIEGAQDPEIQQMTGWLRTWGASVPSGDMSGMGHDMGGEGMMSDRDMAKLKKLSGMSFDKEFLNMMIEHHEGAITMARTEQTGGQATQAKTLAGNIITSQSAEITKMRALLKQM